VHIDDLATAQTPGLAQRAHVEVWGERIHEAHTLDLGRPRQVLGQNHCNVVEPGGRPDLRIVEGASYINDAAGRAIAAFVSVPGVPEQLVWIVSNARGDVLELLDADGNALSYRHYAPYGELTNTGSRAAGSLSATQTAAIRDTVKLRYAGYVYDDESGLYYCSARYYDPITCQFISKDPARADGEESAYQYCGGDPVGKVDPSGEQAVGFSRFPSRVQGRNWCWAASAVAAIEALTRKWVDQRDFVKRVWGRVKHWRASNLQVRYALPAWGVKAKFHLGPPRFKTVYSKLKSRRILIMGHPGHMTALYAANRTGGGSNASWMNPTDGGMYSGSYKDYKRSFSRRGFIRDWVEVWK
jgi:RHS repeat-associated protein